MKTVAELMAELSKWPSDMPVVTRGFDEAGYVDFDVFELVRIVPREHCCFDYDDAVTGGTEALLLN